MISVVATLIATATSLVNSSSSFLLVLVWVFFGIYSQHTSPNESNFQNPKIILVTQVLMAVLVVVSVGAGVKWLRVSSQLNSQTKLQSIKKPRRSVQIQRDKLKNFLASVIAVRTSRFFISRLVWADFALTVTRRLNLLLGKDIVSITSKIHF